MKHITFNLFIFLCIIFTISCNLRQSKLNQLILIEDKCESKELVDYLKNIDSSTFIDSKELLFEELYTCGNMVFDLLLEKCRQFNITPGKEIDFFIEKAISDEYYSINCDRKDNLLFLINSCTNYKVREILLQNIYICDEEILKILLKHDSSINVHVEDPYTGLPILYESFKNRKRSYQLLLDKYDNENIYRLFNDSILKVLLNQKNISFTYDLLYKLLNDSNIYHIMNKIKRVDNIKHNIKDTLWIKKSDLYSHLFCFSPMRNYPWVVEACSFDSLVMIKTDTKHPWYELNGLIPFQLRKISKYTYPANHLDHFFSDVSLNYAHYYDKLLILLEAEHERDNPPNAVIATLWETRGDSMKMIAYSGDYIYFNPFISFDCEIRMSIKSVEMPGPEVLTLEGQISMGDEGCENHSENFKLILEQKDKNYQFTILH